MKYRKKTKILYKFLLFVLSFIALSILITSVILTWIGYVHFEKTIQQDYKNIIRGSAGEIRLFMENAKKGLVSLAWVIAATKIDAWQQQMALTAFNHRTPEFMAVSLISPTGKTIATTRWEPQDFAGTDHMLFKKALSGETAVSKVMMLKDELPFAYIVVPLKRMGQVKEILWGELNLKFVWDVLEGITIGRTGQVFIMDQSGRYVAHREIDRVLAPSPKEKPKILETIRQSDQPIQWNEYKDGKQIFYLGLYIPNLDWVIVLQQSLPEIYAYLYQNIYLAVILTVVISLVAVLIGWRYVKRFLTPIELLNRQVQRISEGDLEYKVSVKSVDEIGELGHAFNHMTDALKDHIQREIEAAKDLVHAKNLAVLGTTSSKVTHEVGNLLNNVGMTLLMLKQEDLGPKGKKALEVLETESLRVREFIHSFLQFAKKPELRLTKTSMAFIVNEVVTALKPGADQRNICFELEGLDDLPKVTIDSGLFYQAITNLVKNSLEAVTESGIIRISGHIETEHLCVHIEDTGPEVDPKILEHIFDPFFSTKGNKGTGLGMSIVKTTVEAHGGTIDVHSPAENGTRVTLRIPIRQFKGRKKWG
jgi:two-component system, NtrC family, sensor kinase